MRALPGSSSLPGSVARPDETALAGQAAALCPQPALAGDALAMAGRPRSGQPAAWTASGRAHPERRGSYRVSSTGRADSAPFAGATRVGTAFPLREIGRPHLLTPV